VAEPGTVIRRATRADADGLGRVAARAWAAAYPGIVPEPVLAEWISGAPANWRESLEPIEGEAEARAWVADRASPTTAG